MPTEKASIIPNAKASGSGSGSEERRPEMALEEAAAALLPPPAVAAAAAIRGRPAESLACEKNPPWTATVRTAMMHAAATAGYLFHRSSGRSAE
jgi:hypothetical protein